MWSGDAVAWPEVILRVMALQVFEVDSVVRMADDLLWRQLRDSCAAYSAGDAGVPLGLLANICELLPIPHLMAVDAEVQTKLPLVGR